SQTPTWPSADGLVVLSRLPNQLADPICEGPKTFSLNSWVLSEFIALTLATQLGPFDPFDGISFISIATPRGGITWLVSSSNTTRAALILLLSASRSQSEKHKAVFFARRPATTCEEPPRPDGKSGA